MDSIGDHDVFKLMSLRGSGDGMGIDPSNDGVDVPITRDTREPIDLRHPSEAVLSAASKWHVMTSDELRAVPWHGMAWPRPGTTLERLKSLSVAGTPIKDYGSTVEMLDAYSAVALSWTRSKCRALWKLADADEEQRLDEHARLIRIAHLFRRIAMQHFDPRVLGRLAQAPVVLPRALRSPIITNPPQRKPPEDRRQKISSAKHEMMQLQTKIAALETIQRSAYATIGMFGADTLDDRFYAALNARLTSPQRNVLGGLIASNRPSRFGDLIDVLGTMDDGFAANSLCSQIHVYEDELAEELPGARPVTAAARPSVRAMGWADLVVVRERLVGYEARELSYVENVLAGEDKLREHERTLRTEDVTETETTKTTESERDLQTSDRFELQSEAQKTISTDFSVDAGVNTSGRYGLTSVDTSLDAGFQRSTQESQRQATQIAKEVVARSVEKVQTSIRELHRRVTIEQLRELNRHSISNVDGSPPANRAGLYLFIEKIHELELRQYGTRLMVEFHIPEPGLTLLEAGRAPKPRKRKPADIAFGPQDINAGNFMCLTQRYGAEGVKPPPPLFKQVGVSWASQVNNSTDATDAEDAVALMLKIPDGFAPKTGYAVVTGRGKTNSNADDPIHAQISVAGAKIIDSGQNPQPSYVAHFPVTLQPADNDGLPVSIRIAGHDDRTATVNLSVTCERTTEAYQAWQLATYEKIRAAWASLVRDYDEAVEQATYDQATEAVMGRPESVNRQLERDELKKWSIKTMRIESYEFDAVIDQGGVQEIDPIASDQQAPIVRFFEEAFEWREMSYFLYPYFWGRRGAWAMRSAIRVNNDPQHEAFLRAGAARVIVPVTPGYEDRVLGYLESDPTLPEIQRIPPPIDQMPANTHFPDLWLELLLDRQEDLALGDGTLNVTHGSVDVAIQNSRWVVSERDVGRELHIDGARYEVASFDPSGTKFQLDRPYTGDTDPAARYAAGSVPFGPPWLTRIPTELVLLSDKPVSDIVRY